MLSCRVCSAGPIPFRSCVAPGVRHHVYGLPVFDVRDGFTKFFLLGLLRFSIASAFGLFLALVGLPCRLSGLSLSAANHAGGLPRGRLP
jgi:hypothetical protein